MKNRTAFFFYYSLAIVTILTVGVFLIAPVPYNFFLALIFGPIAGYFWVSASQMRHTAPREQTQHPPAPLIWQKTKKRIVYASIIATVTFFVAFFMLTILKNLSESSIRYVLGAQTQTASEIQKLKEEIKALQAMRESQVIVLQEIQQLRQDLAQLQTEIQNNKKNNPFEYDTSLLFPTINLSPSPTPLPRPTTGFITINSNKWQRVDVLQDKIPSSRVVGQAVYGKNYEFLKKEQEYYYVVLSSSIKGWIHAQFVKEVNLNIIQNP